MTFFDNESGDDEMHIEPDDYNMVTGLVDKRGLPEFSKATKYTGTLMGMVFKLGPNGLGYYRDCFKMEINLAALLPAVAGAAPVVLRLDEIVNGEHKKGHREDEPDTCRRRRNATTGRKSVGEGLSIGWPSDDVPQVSRSLGL